MFVCHCSRAVCFEKIIWKRKSTKSNTCAQKREKTIVYVWFPLARPTVYAYANARVCDGSYCASGEHSYKYIETNERTLRYQPLETNSHSNYLSLGALSIHRKCSFTDKTHAQLLTHTSDSRNDQLSCSPTKARNSKIITTTTKKWSEKAKRYVHEKLAQNTMERPQSNCVNDTNWKEDRMTVRSLGW